MADFDLNDARSVPGDNGAGEGRAERCRGRIAKPPRPPASAALITGATGGIGEAFAHALPPETSLILTGRDEAKLAALAETFLGRATTVVADLATPEGIETVADAAEAGGCDLLINNAGVGSYGDFLDVPLQAQLDTVRIDVEAVLALTHKVVPGMLARAALSGERAGLINVASSLAFFPVPTFATYAAAKAFILSFTESFDAEMSGKPIDVLAACPGAADTAFGERAGYRGRKMPGAMTPQKVAAASLAALGRQSTVVIGPASAAAFTPVALARSVFGKAFVTASRVMERVR